MRLGLVVVSHSPRNPRFDFSPRTRSGMLTELACGLSWIRYDMTEEEEEEEDAPQGSRFASLPASKVAEGIRQLQAWNQQAAAAPAQAPPAVSPTQEWTAEEGSGRS